ncbi:hypothetical protein Adt_03677 [Abeliophyllum distichum]|uniref:Uncharacterized protein n=1 Tax=Abeliophyllum distichum TaxID=126358 RepID=A0ABD1VZ59_9LAMI
MAPRSKRTTSRKGKEIAEESNAHKRAHHASPTYELYVNSEAEQRATIFSSWSVIAEREVDLDSLNHTILSTIIHDKGWIRLCSKSYSIYMEVVQEFMLNFDFAITDEEEEQAYETMTILYWLATGHNFNFEEYIFNIITDLTCNPKGWSKLIFPILISALCKRAQVSMHLSKKDKAKTPILCLRSVQHSIRQVHRHANECRLAAELEGEDKENSPANEDELVE